MEMDRKKKGVLLLMIAGFLLFFLLMGFFIWAQSSKAENADKEKKNGNVYTEVQNGEEKPMEDSKIKSYRNSRANIENYWDDMGEELDAEPESEDPVDIVTGTRKEASARGARNYTAEDVFGSSPTSQNPAETPAQSSRQDAAERRAMYQRERQAALDEVMRRQEEMMKAQQGAAGNEEAPAVPIEKPRDRIDIDKVMVRKSGSVTTLEDGFTSVTSSGVSSLGSSACSSVQGSSRAESACPSGSSRTWSSTGSSFRRTRT